MRIEIMIDKEQKISQSTLDALESELYRNLRPLYPKTVIRIRKGSSNGVELTGLQLDEERKAAMVSNLLVVLCGNKDAQPIVNSGSLY